MSHLDWALRYASLGWAVLPLKPRGKLPLGALVPNGLLGASKDANTITRWWTQHPDANIGIATGCVSGFCALDVDPRHGGDDAVFKLVEAHGLSLDTITNLTGGGGYQYLYKLTGGTVRNSAGKLGAGLDVRGTGGYICAPDSIHPNGKPYEWEGSSDPFEEDSVWQNSTILEHCIAAIAGTPKSNREAADAPIEEGRRNQHLASLAGALRRRGMGLAGITAALLAENSDRCRPPLEREEVLRVCRSIHRKAPFEEEEDRHEEEDRYANPPTPDEAAFYGIAGEVGMAASVNSEVNAAAACAGFMSFLSANVGRDVYLPVGNTWHHARLYILHVGRSGRARKGDALSITHRIRREIEHADAGLLGGWHVGGLSSKEGLINLIHDGYSIGKKIIPPVTDKRLWVVESEFANILHQGKRDGNTLSHGLRDAWDGITLYPAVKHFPISAKEPHVALAGAITPGELVDVIGKRELTNGFAGRILMFWAERGRLVPQPSPTRRDLIESLAARTAEIIRFARGDYPLMKNTRQMALRPEATELYNAIYLQLSQYGDDEVINAILERKTTMLLRIAALFSLMDLSLEIDSGHIQAAASWVKYWEDSIRFIFRDGYEKSAPYKDGDEVNRKLLDWLTKKEAAGASASELSGYFNRHMSAKEIEARLSLLRGLVKTKVIETKGRPKTVYIKNEFVKY